MRMEGEEVRRSHSRGSPSSSDARRQGGELHPPAASPLPAEGRQAPADGARAGAPAAAEDRPQVGRGGGVAGVTDNFFSYVFFFQNSSQIAYKLNNNGFSKKNMKRKTVFLIRGDTVPFVPSIAHIKG